MCMVINESPEVEQTAQWVGLLTPWSLLYNISTPLPSLSVSKDDFSSNWGHKLLFVQTGK